MADPTFRLIGERLNAHRPALRSKIAGHDADAVLRELRCQQDAGVSHVDLSTAASTDRETADMLWLLETILPELKADVGIALDSLSPDCIAKALFLLKGRPGTLINSNSAELAHWQKLLPLAQQHGAGVVAMLAAGNAPASERLELAQKVLQAFAAAGIPPERQFLDPQILPLGHDAALPRETLKTLQELRRRHPQVHLLAGLSNISFNLPGRGLLNRTYLAMLLASGVDSVLCDPCDADLRQTLIAAQAILGQDDFLATYLSEVK